jgi:hypothetical protein
VTDKFGLYSGVQKDQWYVEDPFDLRHNLGSQCTREGRQRIQEKMQEALGVLREAGNSGGDALAAFERYCATVHESFMLKCRVHVEKVTLKDLVDSLDRVFGVAPFKVHFPADPRGREVVDAFLVFETEKDRRLVHKLNETYVGEWQLRLLPCSKWALEDAMLAAGYEEHVVTPQEKPPTEDGAEAEQAAGDAALEEVRRGLRVAQSKGEVEVLIQRAQALGLPHEEELGKQRLQQLSEGPGRREHFDSSESPGQETLMKQLCELGPEPTGPPTEVVAEDTAEVATEPVSQDVGIKSEDAGIRFQ